MSARRQLTIKPTCMREIATFPGDRVGLLWDKIDLLVDDPLPDGKIKKKLKGADGVYRLRVADHRVFYRFGDDWVSLLGVRRRQEDTYDGLPNQAAPDPLPPTDTDDDLDELLQGSAPKVFTFDVAPRATPLPQPLTPSLLRDLGVPAAAVSALVRCSNEDELLGAPVPAEVLAIVVDALFPPSLDRLVSQPDLVVPSTQHLVRYRDGDLLGFLLQLDEEQRRLTRWALSGPTMVRGGAGTGKSTVALYRVKELLEGPASTGKERVLFTTYTRALLTATRQLMEQLLNADQLRRVTVATCDQVVHGIVSSVRKIGPMEGDRDALQRLARIRRDHRATTATTFEGKLRARAVERLSDEWLLEEFDWIIDGRGFDSLDEYLATPRPGRGIALNGRGRSAVWELFLLYKAVPEGERFVALRREALAVVRTNTWKGHYDHVIVDEAQDLSPVSLALLAEVCASETGLFFAADSKQSLYSRNYSWTSAHPRLQFRGRTALLRRNYRSTREIDRAAFAVLSAEEGESLESSMSLHEGPLPVLVRGVAPDQEARWIERFVRQMARHLHLKANVTAVLVPTAFAGERLEKDLRALGLEARYFAGRDIDLKADVVRLLTLHSAKGLEFPIVVVAGLDDGAYPVPEDFDEPDLFSERARQERRLLYVGLTRAMRGLMVMVPEGCRHPAVADLDLTHWHVEDPR